MKKTLTTLMLLAALAASGHGKTGAYGRLGTATESCRFAGQDYTVTYVGDADGSAYVPTGGGPPHYKATVTVRHGDGIVGVPMKGEFWATATDAEVADYVDKALAREIYLATITPFRTVLTTNGQFLTLAVTNGVSGITNIPISALTHGTNFYAGGWDAGDSLQFRDGLNGREVPLLSTNWVKLWADGDVEHQCGVVTSNWCAEWTFGGATSLWPLSTNVLTLERPPQRTVTNALKTIINGGMVLTNGPGGQWWGYGLTNYYYWTNSIFVLSNINCNAAIPN